MGMTTNEAIEILQKNRPTSDPRPCGMELCDAVDMAISALRQQEHFREVTKKVEPLTNAQKIRSMSDEELNELFHEIYNAGAEDAVAYEWGQRTNSFEWTMEWLQQPAEEDEHGV